MSSAVNCTIRDAKLHFGSSGRGFVQVDGLILPALDALADLLYGFTLLTLKVCVVGLLQTGTAVRCVVGFKAGTQAFVSDALAIAVAGKLIKDRWDLLGDVVTDLLVLRRVGFAGALRLGNDGNKLCAFGRRTGMVRGNVFRLCKSKN
jgi:hypothetical protein